MLSIRTIIAMATQNKWPIYQMDVKLAFLNGDLDEEIYVEQHPSFVVPGLAQKVCRTSTGSDACKRAWAECKWSQNNLMSRRHWPENRLSFLWASSADEI